MVSREQIKAMLTPGYINYSSKAAASDLARLTNNYYCLDGYTGKYMIVAEGKTIMRQQSCKLPLRAFVVEALALFLNAAAE